MQGEFWRWVEIYVKYIEVAALLTLAVISDFRTCKIRNDVIYPFIMAGLLTNCAINGYAGLLFSIWGLLMPSICLIALYLLRMMGAGDIKLFGAVGAIMGAGFTGCTMLYSFAAGGVAAAVLLIMRRNSKRRLRHLIDYIKSCYLTMSLLPYCDFEDKLDSGKFHFAPAVAVGALGAICAQAGILF